MSESGSSSGSSSSASSRRRQFDDDEEEGSWHSGSGSDSAHSSRKKPKSATPYGDADISDAAGSSNSSSSNEGSAVYISDSDVDDDAEISTSSRQEEEGDDDKSQKSGSEESKGSSFYDDSEEEGSANGSAGSGSRQSDNEEQNEQSDSSRKSEDDASGQSHHSTTSQEGEDSSESQMSGDGSESQKSADESGHSKSTRVSAASGSPDGDDDQLQMSANEVGSDSQRSGKDGGSEHSRSSKGSSASGSQAGEESEGDGSQQSESSKGSAGSGSQQDKEGSESQHSDDKSLPSKSSNGSDASQSKEEKEEGDSLISKQSDNSSQHSRSSRGTADSGASGHSSQRDDQSTVSSKREDDDSDASKSRGSTLSKNSGGTKSKEGDNSSASSSQSDDESDSKKSGTASTPGCKSSAGDTLSAASGNTGGKSKESGSSEESGNTGGKSKESGSSAESGNTGGKSKESGSSAESRSSKTSVSAAAGSTGLKSKESESSAQSGSSKTSVSAKDSNTSDERGNKSDNVASSSSPAKGAGESSTASGVANRGVVAPAQSAALVAKKEKAKDSSDTVPKGRVSAMGKMFAFKEAKPSRFGDPPSVSGDPKSQKSSQQSVKSQTSSGKPRSSKASWISQTPKDKNVSDPATVNRSGIPLTKDTESKLAQGQKMMEIGETNAIHLEKDDASAKKHVPTSNDLEKIMERRRSQTEAEVMVTAGTDSFPLEGKGTAIQQTLHEEAKTEVTNDEPTTHVPAKKPKKRIIDVDEIPKSPRKIATTDSRSTALTAETVETATEKDRSVARESDGGEARLEQIAEPDVLGNSDEGSMTEYVEESVTESEEAAEADLVVEARLKKGAESDEFLGEIVSFAESQNALGFSWVPDEVIEIVVEESEEEEEEIVEDEDDAAKAQPTEFDHDFDNGDELMGRYSSTDEYLYSETRTRESRSLRSIPEVVEFGRQEGGVQSAVLSRDDGTARTPKSVKYEDDEELPFDEACEDHVKEKVTKDLLEEFPEIKSAYDIANGDLDGLLEVVRSYKERLQTLAEERKELLMRDNAEANAASANRKTAVDVKKPDAVERTRKLLEKLKVATLSRKKGIPVETMSPPEGKLKSTEVRKQEVLSSVHQVDWAMFRTRKTLEKAKAGAESSDRDIPPQFEEARDTLARSQEHFSALRKSVTNTSNATRLRAS